MTSRRMERIAGIASGVSGVAGLLLVLFGPVYEYTAYTSSGVIHGSKGLLVSPDGFLLIPPPPYLIVPAMVSFALPLLIAISALLHSRQSGSLVGLVLLLGATAALLIEIIFNPIQMLQLFLLPSLLLALVACACAVRTGRSANAIAAGQV